MYDSVPSSGLLAANKRAETNFFFIPYAMFLCMFFAMLLNLGLITWTRSACGFSCQMAWSF